MKTARCLTIVMTLAVSFLFAAEEVKKPAAARTFYPAYPEILQKDVDGYIAAARVPAIDGKIVAVIAPHAGYDFSGAVAGYTYKAIKKEFVS